MPYVACIYDAKWWVDLLEEVDKCNNDILVNFMHPFGPSKHLFGLNNQTNAM